MQIFKRAFIDTLNTVGGPWKTILSITIVPGFVAGVWYFQGRDAAMNEWKLVAIYFGSAGVFGLVLFVFNLWLAPYRLLKERVEEISSDKGIPKPPGKADPKHWKGVEIFKLKDAACLWVGVEPHWPLYTRQAMGMYAELEGAFQSGKLPRQLNFGEQLSLAFSAERPNLWVKPDQPVHRDSLIKYVRSKGKSLPRFLAINAESKEGIYEDDTQQKKGSM